MNISKAVICTVLVFILIVLAAGHTYTFMDSHISEVTFISVVCKDKSLNYSEKFDDSDEFKCDYESIAFKQGYEYHF